MSLHALLVPGYVQMLRGLSGQLKKGLEWASAADVSEEDFLSARLAPDMHPCVIRCGLCAFRPGMRYGG